MTNTLAYYGAELSKGTSFIKGIVDAALISTETTAKKFITMSPSCCVLTLLPNFILGANVMILFTYVINIIITHSD